MSTSSVKRDLTARTFVLVTAKHLTIKVFGPREGFACVVVVVDAAKTRVFVFRWGKGLLLD